MKNENDKSFKFDIDQYHDSQGEYTILTCIIYANQVSRTRMDS